MAGTPSLLEVLQASVYVGCEVTTVAQVIAFCQAAGLDPLLKPVHVLRLPDPASGALVPTIVPGIGLYRTIAARCGCAGIEEPEFGPDVTEPVGGQMLTYPHWCRIRVHRQLASGAVVTFTAKEYWSENVSLQPGPDGEQAPSEVWRRRPFGQLAKCTEAQALRKAFPEIGAQPVLEELEGKSIGPAAALTADVAIPTPIAMPTAVPTAVPTASTTAMPTTRPDPAANAATGTTPGARPAPTLAATPAAAGTALPTAQPEPLRAPAQLELVASSPCRANGTPRQVLPAAGGAARPVQQGRSLRAALEAAWPVDAAADESAAAHTNACSCAAAGVLPSASGAATSPPATAGEIAYVRGRIERKGLTVAAAFAAAALPVRSTLKGLTQPEFTALLALTS